MPDDVPDDVPDQDDARDQAHQRPDGVPDATVEALGKLAAAVDEVEVARGFLYHFHKMMGRAEDTFEQAYDLLREAGLDDVADALDRDVLGANALPGMWTFQMVEGFDDGYWTTVRSLQQRATDDHVGGRRHVFEAEMKELRRTHGRRGHEATPDETPPVRP